MGIVSAGTLPLSTTKNGTVSGDLYVGAFQNPPWNNQVTPPGVKEYTQSYTIPAFTTIQWARLETVVYAAGTDNRHGQTTVKFDGNGDGTYETTLGVEDQETASSTDGNVYPVNDHMDRCYSDYRIWYNVTNLITAQNPAAFVKTENLNTSTFDGRVKEITLIVAYNDGDSDQVMYWVNTGHDYQASGAAGVTTSFDTTAVPAGFTTATLRNVGLASKDALYTFNTLTPTGGDPIVPYNYFETHAWDVTSGITAGSASFFGYTNNGGSFKTTLATLTVRSASEEQPDLIVTEIKPNVGAGAYLFANEPNVITINVRNEGIGSAGASTLSVDVGGTVYTTTIIALEAGENSTVTVTDTVSRTGGDTVMVTATADSAGIITESDETNNVLTPAALTVYNNGYKGKRWTGGDDITTQAGPFNGHYGLVYSVGNATYGSAGWTERTTGWTASDLPVPAGATVTSARLYQGYTWDQTPGGSPLWTVTFNGAIISPAATYKDTKGWGTYSDREQGIFVYDVTGQFLTAGNSMTITSLPGNDNGIYGAYLVVVYQDPATSEKTIWINDECDSLYAGTARSVTNDEATAYANFAGVNTSGVANAQAIAFLQSAGDSGKSRFFFNDNEFPGFWPDYRSGPQIGFSSYNVTSALASGANEARLQSYGSGTDGDNMYATNVILVVEKTVAPIAPVAAFSGTPVNGNAPLKVVFTDTSSGSITSRAWEYKLSSASTWTTFTLAGDNSYTFTSAGAYDIRLTVTGPGGSDSEVKTSFITVAAVTPAPVAAFSGTPVNGNAPLRVVFTDTSSGSITSRAWEYKLSSASTWTTFTLAGDNSYTFTSAGAYDIRLTVTGPGGSDSEVKTSYITVAAVTPAPVAAFSGTPVNGNAPLKVVFTDTSSGSITSRAWEYKLSSASTWTTFTLAGDNSYTFTSAGAYDIRLTVTGPGGSDIETRSGYITVTAVTPAPVAAFSGTPVNGNAPLKVVFTDTSTGSITSRTWEYKLSSASTWTTFTLAGDNSYTFTSAGAYDIRLTVTGPGGSDSEVKTSYITVAAVTPAPVAAFSGTPVNGNAPLKVVFTDTSSGSITSRAWEYKLSSASTWTTFTLAGDNSYTFTSAGAYDIRLTVTGPGGSDSEVKTSYITVAAVTPAPVAAFSGTPVNGNAPLKVVFTDTSSGSITSRAWEYKLSSASTWTTFTLAGDNSYTFTSAGAYDIRLTVTGPGGSDSEVKTSYITVAAVTPAPVAAFSGTPVNGNAPLKVVFTDTSSGSITSRAWEYKLSSASTWTTFTLAGDNSYTFTSAGAYDIRLTVTGPGGSDSEVKTSYITVSTPTPTISAQFTASPVSGYTPLAVRFTDQSTGPVSSYEWDFNNDGIVDSRMKNPLKFFMSSGKYTVKQTVRGPDGMDEEIKNQYIEVSARPMRPIALFSADKLSGTAPLNVTFTDESYNNPNTFLWKFGDGATSNAKDPSHTYQSPGYYKVSLTVSNAAGSSSRAMNIYVMNS